MTSPPSQPKHRRTSSTISSEIYTSCRALQARLSTSMSQSTLGALRAPTLLPSPVFTPRGTSSIRKEKTLPAHKQPQTPPRSALKRRRSVSDNDGRALETEKACAGRPSTPKRQRMAPPSIPLGLSPGDFEHLDSEPRIPSPPLRSTAFVPPSESFTFRKARPRRRTPTITPTTYSSSLVSLIVEKLSLDEKVRGRLGSEPEDIDERWRVLLREAEMARGMKVRRDMVIRRGRRERTSLDALGEVW